jgi:hypothetical protein
MWLIAEGTDWVSVLSTQGPLAVVFLLIVVGVCYYGPRLVNGHMEFLRHTKDTQQKLTSSYEKLTETCEQIAAETTESRKLQERMAETFRCRAGSNGT